MAFVFPGSAIRSQILIELISSAAFFHSRVFRRPREDLPLVELEVATVRFADDAFFNIGRRTGLREERDFEEHRTGEVDAFEELEINVHVEGKLSLTF